MNSEVIGRKEILFISLFSSLIFLEKKIIQKLLLPIFVIFIIILGLSHSGFIFYIPYFLALYILVKTTRNLNFNFIDFLTFIIITIFLIFLIYFFEGSQLHIDRICESVTEFVSKDCGIRDQISWLNNNIDIYLSEKFLDDNLLKNYLFVYIPSIFCVFFFISLKFLNSKFEHGVLKKFNPFFTVIVLFICTLPIYILGLDWGRYIYLSYSSTFFLYIYCLKNKILTFNDLNFFHKSKLSKIFFITFIFFYSFFWTFPFYGGKNFKLILNKPILSVLKKFDQ